jgi:signal transduction histidine kinase
VIRSNSRAARLVNQLLLMMRSEARIDTEMETVPLDDAHPGANGRAGTWRLRAELSWNSSPRMTSGSTGVRERLVAY